MTDPMCYQIATLGLLIVILVAVSGWVMHRIDYGQDVWFRSRAA